MDEGGVGRRRPNARHLWRRIDGETKAAIATPNSPLACAWDACKGLWQRSDIPAVYAALERCPWDAELAPLVAELRGAFGARAPLS